jgi:hypothetical protein
MSSNSDWLGGDTRQWTRAMGIGWARAYIVFAFHQTGIFEALRDGGPQTSAELGARCKVDAYLLDGVLNFFAFCDDLIVKTGDRFALTDKSEWVFSDNNRAFAMGLVGAYGCLMENLTPALKGEKHYGVDFERVGDLLATGSHLVGRHAYPWIVSQILGLGKTVVADLGCGSADVLMSLCELEPRLRGVGLDISAGALEEAGRRIEARKLSGRIRLVQADLTQPHSYVSQLAEVEVFNAIMVFHEFLRDGEERLIDLFRAFSKQFPGRYLLLGEFNRVTDDELRAIPDYRDRFPLLQYQYLIHPLSLQGLPQPKAKWLDLLGRANVEVVDVHDSKQFRLLIYVIKL